jgi:hypothetical protein
LDHDRILGAAAACEVAAVGTAPLSSRPAAKIAAETVGRRLVPPRDRFRPFRQLYEKARSSALEGGRVLTRRTLKFVPGSHLPPARRSHFRLPCRRNAAMDNFMTALSIKTVWWWGC